MEALKDLDVQCEVEWKGLWKSISESIVIICWVLIPVTILGRYITTGFDYAKTFEHISLLGAVIMMLAAPIVIPVAMLLIVPFAKMAGVSIRNSCLYGRDNLMRKRMIPLLEIQNITQFSDNGISTFVFHGKDDKKILILNIESMKEVLELLFLFCKQNAIQNSTKEETS